MQTFDFTWSVQQQVRCTEYRHLNGGVWRTIPIGAINLWITHAHSAGRRTTEFVPNDDADGRQRNTEASQRRRKTLVVANAKHLNTFLGAQRNAKEENSAVRPEHKYPWIWVSKNALCVRWSFRSCVLCVFVFVYLAVLIPGTTHNTHQISRTPNAA